MYIIISTEQSSTSEITSLLYIILLKMLWNRANIISCECIVLFCSIPNFIKFPLFQHSLTPIPISNTPPVFLKFTSSRHVFLDPGSRHSTRLQVVPAQSYWNAFLGILAPYWHNRCWLLLNSEDWTIKWKYLHKTLTHLAIASHSYHWILAITRQFLQPVPNISEAHTNKFCVEMNFPFYWTILKISRLVYLRKLSYFM